LAETGPHRVRDHVAANGRELVLVFDRTAPEALAEEVAPAPVASVEALRVAAVELLEAGRELGDRGFDDEVVVVRHQAEGVQAPVVLGDDDSEEPEERAAVVIVAVDGDLPGPARGEVEEAVGEDVARQACHRSKVGGRAAHRIGPRTKVTLLTQKPCPLQPCPGTVPSHGRERGGPQGRGRSRHGWGQSSDVALTDVVLPDLAARYRRVWARLSRVTP
jgi:hypothetical protein